MKSISTLLNISFLIVILFSSCQDGANYTPEDVDCSECFEDYPEYAEIELEFNRSLTLKTGYITVYSGHAENSPIVYESEIKSNYKTLYLESNQYYSFLAEYYDNENDRYFYVIKDCFPEPVYIRNICDIDCYYIEDNYVDLRLSKYESIDFDMD